MESFERCHGCIVSPEKVGLPLSMIVEDSDNRSLRLSVTSEMLGGTALKVSGETLTDTLKSVVIYNQLGMATDMLPTMQGVGQSYVE